MGIRRLFMNRFEEKKAKKNKNQENKSTSGAAGSEFLTAQEAKGKASSNFSLTQRTHIYTHYLLCFVPCYFVIYSVL